MITVLIPTSPIPSHPSTKILDETIANVRNYTDAEIIIMADGVHPSLAHRMEDYNEYLWTVIDNIKADKYGNCSYTAFPTHTHQAAMTRQTLSKLVRTPLIFFVEHDTFPVGEIPFDKIMDIVKNESCINYIRFNIFSEIIPEHKYLMIENVRTLDGVRLQRTIQWSQRPHIAKSIWYRNILTDYFKPGDRMMIEDRMHSVVQWKFKEYEKDIFGMYIFTPFGDQLRSAHLDGRGSDTKIIEG